MNNRNEFDRAFREKLEHYASPTPTHLWEAIEAKRAEQPRRGWKIAYWPWLGALLFVLLIGGGTWAYQHFDLWEQKTDEEATSSTSINTDSPGLTSTAGLLPDAAVSEALAADKTAAQADLSAGSTTTAEKKTSTESAKAAPVTQKEVIRPSSTGSTSARAVSAQQLNIDQSLFSAEPSTPAGAQSNAAENATNSGSSGDPSDADSPNLQQAAATTSVALLHPIAWGAELPDALESEVAKMPLGSKCEDFKAKGVNFYLDLYTSPELPIRTLTAKSEDYLPYAQLRNETEAVNHAFGGGVRVATVLANGASFRTGLEYTQINELFSYENPDATRVNVEYVLDSLGNILWADTSYVNGTHIKMTHNRYKILDIPVAIGYELELANFVLSIHGGAYFNLLFRQKGDFLAPDNLEPVNFTSKEPNAYPAFRSNVGVSLAGSFGLNYKLNSNTLLLFEPHFRYFLKPFSNDDYVLSQRYFNTGITLGLRLKL